MNNNKVSNPEVSVPQTTEMNDRDILNVVLECNKCLSNNLSTALNELSNTDLYNNIYKVFEETKKMSRELYELMFRCGWYSLEKAEEQKITQTFSELNQKLSEVEQ